MSTPGLRAYGATDTGRQRAHNEDCFLCDPDAGLFIVADGVGGYAAGEVAAALACTLIREGLRQQAGPPAERLRRAITEANNEIYRRSLAHPAQRGMACVLTAVVVEGGTVTVGHVGDTRLYEIREAGIRKITRDHSPVGLREDGGALSEIEAMTHPRRSEILRDVGSAPHAPEDADFIDLYQLTFAPDSALLLCSDGLTDLVPKAPIQQVVLEHAGRPEAGVQTLIELANEVGGPDNITVVVVEGPAFRQALAGLAPAETFAAVARPAEAVAHAPSSLRRRRACFVYGLAVGCLLAVLPLLAGYRWVHEEVAPEAPAVEHRAQTLRVAADGTGAYRTLYEALRAARPGDVVEVAPGVYHEPAPRGDSLAVPRAFSLQDTLVCREKRW